MGGKVASNRLKELGWWIGLAAMALQIALSPILSSRALAMELDPLAQVQICVTAPDGSQSPNMPADHAGHCTECCLVHCAAHAVPVLPPVTLDLAAPRVLAAAYDLARTSPLPRGPPARIFSATGPPILV